MVKPSEPTYDCNACPSYCCNSVYDHVEVSLTEMMLIAGRLKISLKKFIRKYTKPIKGETDFADLKRVDDFLLDKTCVFLDQATRLCTIHEVRPMVCRDYPHTFLDKKVNNCQLYDLHRFVKKEQGKHFVPLTRLRRRKV